ncbi:methyl-accepting chemotaxis protein [Clostridia bacterium]|nr:methyl-accepting chemotaxis protein [Clostridia bacterium]
MKNLKIAVKLIVSFVIVIALTAVVGIVGIYATTSMTEQGRLLDARANIGVWSAQLQSSIREQQGALRGVALYYSIEDQSQAEAQLKAVDDSIAAATAYLNQIGENASTDATKELLAAITDYRSTYGAARATYIDSLKAAAVLDNDLRGAALSAALDTFAPFLTQYLEHVSAMPDAMVKATTEQFEEMQSLSNMVTLILIAVLAVAIIVALVLAFYISNLISKPIILMSRVLAQVGKTGNLQFSDSDLRDAAEYAKGQDETAQAIGNFSAAMQQFVYYGDQVTSVASNDLTVDIKTLGGEDTIGNALVRMVQNLNESFNEINDATGQVSSGSKQIADGAQGLAQGSTQQAAAVEELSSSISEIAEKTKENAAEAGRAASLSDAVRRNAEKGSAQMNDMIQAVKEINEASQSIQKVINVIDNIAFQTNILALNAAVEAARAGQHGKGFAVVAEEVRNLAAKSAAAASDTGSLIANSMEKAELGAKIAGETAASLTEIVDGINESSKIVSNIATSSEEQSLAISQINNGIDQVAQVVQQNSATSEESAATAEELSSQSSVLEDLVSQFKLKGANGSRKSLGGARQKKTLSMPAKGESSFDSGDFGKY